MICITGAGGTLGSEILAQLQATAAPPRAAFNSPAKAEAARARGIEAVVVDYADPAGMAAAFDGCERLFLLGPNVVDQTRLETSAVMAARQAGVKHIVKQSVLGAATLDYSLARVHRPVEQAIEASGMAWTFLRPNSFMQNVMTFMAPTIRAESAFFSASGDGRISHIDVRDIAAVAVQALTGSGHEGRAYELTGPESLSYNEVAQALSDALGRPVAHVDLPPEALREAMLAEGLPELIANRLLDLERLFREGDASRVTDEVRRVTGQEPRRYADYLREIAAELAT